MSLEGLLTFSFRSLFPFLKKIEIDFASDSKTVSSIFDKLLTIQTLLLKITKKKNCLRQYSVSIEQFRSWACTVFLCYGVLISRFFRNIGRNFERFSSWIDALTWSNLLFSSSANLSNGRILLFNTYEITEFGRWKRMFTKTNFGNRKLTGFLKVKALKICVIDRMNSKIVPAWT